MYDLRTTLLNYPAEWSPHRALVDGIFLSVRLIPLLRKSGIERAHPRGLLGENVV